VKLPLLALCLSACSGPAFTVADQTAELDARETGAVDIQISVTYDVSPPEAASVGDAIHSPLDALADATPGDDAAPEAGVVDAGPRYEAGPFTVAGWPCPDQPIPAVGWFYLLIAGNGAMGPATVLGSHCDVSSAYQAPAECQTAATFVCACIKSNHPCVDVDGRPFLLEGDGISCGQPNPFNAKCYGP
jgi:hypothetical protein